MSVEEVRKLIANIDLNDHRDIVNLIRRTHYSVDLAEECLQEAYVEALINAEKIQTAAGFKSWLITVATRKAYRDISQCYKIAQACYTLSRLTIAQVDDKLLRIVLTDTIAKVLQSYPAYYADILRLRYVYQCSFKEISAILGINPAVVRQAHHRMKNKLRARLEAIL